MVKDAIIILLKQFKDWVHTVTFDNGLEFTQHQTLAEELGCKTFFARPYHSWERGLNENHNGLLRQYFPKSANSTTAHAKPLVIALLGKYLRK